MTAKRFTSQRTDDYNFSDILDNGKWIGICHVDCEDDFVDKLNELHEKKEILEVQLKGATIEIDKLRSEIDMLTDTYHDCCKEIREENEQLKKENYELNKSVGYLDEIVKEQCNKIAWADECGVRWEEEYEKWKG